MKLIFQILALMAMTQSAYGDCSSGPRVTTKSYCSGNVLTQCINGTEGTSRTCGVNEFCQQSTQYYGSRGQTTARCKAKSNPYKKVCGDGNSYNIAIALKWAAGGISYIPYQSMVPSSKCTSTLTQCRTSARYANRMGEYIGSKGDKPTSVSCVLQ